jgi:diguanylate cyclase (GGDEF)-like protein
MIVPVGRPDGRRADVRAEAELAMMARLQAGLWAGGALLAFLIAALPHPPETNATGYLIAGLVALAIGVLVFATAGRAGVGLLQVSGLVGTALISLCVYFSGEHSGAPATDNEMLYLWVVIFSAYFFTRRQAALQLAWVAVTYLAVLMYGSVDSVFATRWAETVGTLLVVGLLVATLRDRIADLIRRLADAARTDPLTGLQNRRGFEETFAMEVERARRHVRPLSVLVGDLDHFKLVNDRLGHPAGDAALVRMGDLLRSARRRIDPVARTGGEEFAVILPEAAEREAYLVAERLRAAVQRAFGDGAVPLTISFGLATLPEHGLMADELLAAADQALYAAKELGRNRTVVYSQEIQGLVPSDGPLSPQLRELQLGTLLALAEAIDLRDNGTTDHSQGVARYSALIARELGLSTAHVRRIEIAGALHDIGKVGLPDAILRKETPLKPEEWIQLRRHPELGAELLGDGHFDDVRPWVLAHHERMDGTGYPFGLSAHEIPLEARIIAVAEQYEAMTADRVYRKALGADAARANLRRSAGSALDADVVDALLRVLEREAAAIGRRDAL